MRIFTKLGSALFGVIGLLHLARLAYGWEAVIGGLEITLWASGVAVVLAAVLSWGLWKESR